MSEPQRTDAEKTQSPSPDWTRIRQRFPVLEHKTYLNSCSYGAMSLMWLRRRNGISTNGC
jgi:hypothetical protein